MAIRNIVTYPDDVLVTRAEPLSDVDGAVAALMDDMAETMYKANGIGLAAPQVGVSRRVLTMDVGPADEGGGSQLLQIANPIIVEGHGEIVYEEGCLSFPGITAEVLRMREIFVRGVDREGNEVQLEATGLAAICLQHEIDHLEGIPFVDRLKGLKRRLVLREYAKAKKQFEEQLRQGVA